MWGGEDWPFEECQSCSVGFEEWFAIIILQSSAQRDLARLFVIRHLIIDLVAVK